MEIVEKNIVYTPEMDEQWELVIEPKAHWFDLRLGDVWRYRDLLLLFVKRDFVAQYKQTVLGPLWHIVQPALTTVIFLLVFSKIANISTNGIPPVLFYMSGITIWNYFAACLTSTSNTFVANAGIFGKVYFPRLVLPLSVIFSNMVRFSIQFFLLMALLVYYHFQGYPMQLGVQWLLIPVVVLLMAGLGLGTGIIISSLTTKYRDFAVLTGFGVQLLMFATPVAYPASYLKGKSYEWIAQYNPLTGIVETFKYAIFRQGELDGYSLLYSSLFMVVVLLAGLMMFSKVEKSFMDTV